MAPKSFVLDLILTPLNQYPVLAGVRDVTSSRISHEQTQSNRVCCFPTLYFHCNPRRLFSLFYRLLETRNLWLLQDLRQNGVGRVFERVNICRKIID